MSYRYRDAGAEVIDVLCRHCKLVERASVDEAYLDLTDDVSARMLMMQNSTNGTAVTVDDVMLPNTHVVGYENAADDDKGTLRRSMFGNSGDISVVQKSV